MNISIFDLIDLARQNYPDLVNDIVSIEINQFRLILIDQSFLDVWYSLKIENRYSFHWERSHINRGMYRHDNIPHKNWEHITSFPKHFHCGSQENVTDSQLPDNPVRAFEYFLNYIRTILKNEK